MASLSLEKNVFTKEQLDSIYKYIFKPEHERRWTIQKHCWSEKIKDKSIGVVAVFELKDEIEMMIAKRLCKFLKPEEKFRSIQYYEWNQLSQINWHTDPHATGAITIYLNENWDPDWGGFFCVRNGESDTGEFIIPMFNSAVILRGNPNHHVSLVNPLAPVRKTIQIWITDSPAGRVSQTLPLEPVQEEQ